MLIYLIKQSFVLNNYNNHLNHLILSILQKKNNSLDLFFFCIVFTTFNQKTQVGLPSLVSNVNYMLLFKKNRK